MFAKLINWELPQHALTLSIGVGVALAQPNFAHAGVNEVTVRNQYSAQDAYVVAYPVESAGQSELKPGVYALKRGTNQPTLVMKGIVLGVGRSFNGILGQFPMSRYTNRTEALAVVDGKLQIFSSRSTPNRRDSTVEIGSKNYPVVDTLSKRPLVLPTITNINDVQFAAFDTNSVFNPFLISIKTSNPLNPRETGVLIAGLLRRPTTSDAAAMAEIEVVGSLQVIDYAFYQERDLRRLFVEEDPGKFISPLHLNSFIPELPGDNVILKEWRKKLAQVLRYVARGQAAAGNGGAAQKTDKAKFNRILAQTPLLSLVENQVVFKQFPFARVANKPLAIYQFSNPQGSSGSSILVRTEEDADVEYDLDPKTPPTLSGLIDIHPRTGAFRIYPVRGARPAALVVINGRAHILYADVMNKISFIDVSSVIDPNFTQISIATASAPSTTDVKVSGWQNHIFFVSRSMPGGGAQTDAIVVEDRDGVARYEGRFTINRKYMSERELAGRIQVNHEDNVGGVPEVLFDTVSSTDRVERGRANRENLTTPLVHIVKSMHANKVVQDYLSAIQSQELIESWLEYKRFDPKGSITPQSGFYFSRIAILNDVDAREPIHFVPGEIIKAGSKPRPDLALDKRTLNPVTLPDKTRAHEFDVAAYAYNPDPGKKPPENRFATLIAVTPAHVTPSVSAGIATVEIPTDIGRLSGAKIVQASKGRGLNVSILFAFKASGKDAKRNDRGGVYVVNFDISNAALTDRKSRITNLTQGWIEREQIRPDQVRQRLVRDVAGDLYWILTPHLEKHDRHFKVKKFTSPEEDIFVNAYAQKIQLRFGEPVDDDDYKNLMQGMSHWLVDNRFDVEQISPKVKAHLEELEKKSDKKENEGSSARARTLFPNWRTFLEKQAQRPGTVEHQVILVEAAHKEFFVKSMAEHLMSEQSSQWHYRNPKFKLFVAKTNVDYDEMRAELEKIVTFGNDVRRVLWADLGELLAAQGVEVAKDGTLLDDDNGDGNPDDPGEDADQEEENQSKNTKASQAQAQSEPEQETDEEGEETDEDGEVAESAAFPGSLMMALAGEGDRVTVRTAASRLKAQKRIPMMILATPAEWRALHNHFDDEDAAGVYDGFRVNSEFLTSTWSVWSPKSGRASEEIVKAAATPISLDEFRVFPNLEKLLTSAATKGEPARHKLVVVPDELKGLVRRLVLTRWASDAKALQGLWNHSNFNLSLFMINSTNMNQETVAENFEALRGSKTERRSVLLGDMAEILKIGRPVSSGGHETTFELRDPAASKSTSVNALSGDEKAKSLQRQPPHLMYWLATEGHRLQPKNSRDWSVNQNVAKEVPTLIFATESELAQMEAATSFEGRFHDWRKHWDLERLEVPAPDTRVKLVMDLFSRRDISSLNYKFRYKDREGEVAKRELVTYMVSYVEDTARNQGQEPTSAFIKAYLELNRSLTEDSTLRQEGILDKQFFDRLYRRVFSLPLSFDILRPDDPLLKLKDPDVAALRLSERGYEGSTALKRDVIQTVTSQTRGTDGGRPIPSSMILFGSTSTGKTYLWDKIFLDLLGLKLYDFTKPQDDTVMAFKINAGTVLEERDPNNPGKLAVDDVIAHLDHFVSLQHGYRGAILLDDLHLGAPKVRQKLIQWVKGLQEAPSGVYLARSLDKTKAPVAVPVRNINIAITINPQQDRDVRKKYVSEWGTGELDKEIVASLAGGDVTVDESFIARFALKVNLDKFPRDAKMPTLVARVRKGAHEEFSSHARVPLLSPSAVREFVNRLPSANAREFLSTATYATLSLTEGMPAAPIYVIQPASDSTSGGRLNDALVVDAFKNEKVTAQELSAALKSIMVIRPVAPQDIGSMLHLTSFMLDGFRLHLFHSLVTAAQRLPRAQMRTDDLVSFLLATIDTLDDSPSVPLNAVRMMPNELVKNYNQAQLADFNETLRRLSPGEKSFFRVTIPSGDTVQHVQLNQFMQSNYAPRKRGRADVMGETAAKVEKILADLAAVYFRVSSINSVPEAGREEQLQKWAAELGQADDLKEPDKNIKLAFKSASDRIVALFFEFSREISDRDLVELSRPSPARDLQLTDYDRMRLFIMCVDKALTQMPWGPFTRFMTEAANLATSDLSVGLRAPMQNLLFKSAYSPFGTVTSEGVVDIAKTTRELGDFSEKAGESLKRNFSRSCENLLLKEGR